MVGAQINHSQIEADAKNIADLLGEQHFANQKTINGQEILRLSDVKQINFFVLKNLFEKWQDETRNLRSPYFNYRSEKVSKALVAFMNILSQNIEIEKAAFMPLLTTAVQDTLYLIFTPFDHFWAELSQGPEVLSIKNLKAKGKYIKQNKHIYDAFLESVTQAFDDKISKEDALTLLEGLIQDGNLEVEEKEPIIAELSQIHPLDTEAIYRLPEPEEPLQEEEAQSDEDLLSDLFDDDTLDYQEETEAAEADQTKREELPEPQSDEKENQDEPDEDDETDSDQSDEEEPEETLQEASVDTLDDDDVYENEQVREDEEALADDASDEVEDEEDDTSREEEVQSPRKLVRKSTSMDEGDSSDITDQKESLNKKYSQEKKTINDQLKDQEKMTIADIHETQSIGKMQESISVNQRYMFINELFSGNAEHYNKAISDIERCESFDDSVELMIQKYAKKLDWNMNSPEVKELLKVIFKRYR